MFYTIRKVLFVLIFGLVVGAAVWLYQRRVVFQPVEDWVEVLKNRKSVPQIFEGRMSGTVISIHDGDTFKLRDEAGQTFAVSLVGIAAPEFRRNQPAALTEMARQSKTNLAGLILSNSVTVDVTYSTPQRAALGIVQVGSTNLNVLLARSGWVEVKRDYIRTLPATTQVALIQAEREAQEAKLGIWRDPPPAGAEQGSGP